MSALDLIKDMQFVAIAPDCEAYDTVFCFGRDLIPTLAGLLYSSPEDMPDDELARLKELADNPDNWWEFEGIPTGLDWDIGAESGCVIKVWRLTADGPRIDVQRKLIALARAAWSLADDAEETDSPYITVHEDDFKALSAALDTLDKLPELPAPYVGEGPVKAEFALGLREAEKPKLGGAL